VRPAAELDWASFPWRRLALHGLFVAAFTLLVMLLAAASLRFIPASARQLDALVFYGIYGLCLPGVYRLAVRVAEGRVAGELTGWRRDFPVGAAMGIAAAIVVVMLDIFGGRLYPDRLDSGLHFALEPSLLLLACLAVAIAAAEETIFRGIVMRFAIARLGVRAGVVAQALVFGATHYWRGGYPNVLFAIAMGIVLGLAMLWTRRLALPIGLHAGWDFVWLAASGSDVLTRSWATDNPWNPDGDPVPLLAAEAFATLLLQAALATWLWRRCRPYRASR
jgi:membrane protease YdiL (CAAX protease family)